MFVIRSARHSRRCLAAASDCSPGRRLSAPLRWRPIGFFPAFLVPMVLAVWLIDGSAGGSLLRSLRRAGEAGWWLGFGYFVAGLWWLGSAFLAEADKFAWALPLGVLGLPAVLAFFTAFGFVLARLMWSSGAPAIFALAAALSLAEWLRGHVLTGFPWNDFGMVLGGNLHFRADGVDLRALWPDHASVLIFAAPALLGDGRNAGRLVPAWPARRLGCIGDISALARLQNQVKSRAPIAGRPAQCSPSTNSAPIAPINCSNNT